MPGTMLDILEDAKTPRPHPLPQAARKEDVVSAGGYVDTQLIILESRIRTTGQWGQWRCGCALNTNRIHRGVQSTLPSGT